MNFEFLAHNPDTMEGLPVHTSSEMEDILVREFPARVAFENIELSAQSQVENDGFPAQILPNDTEQSAQTHIAEKEFSLDEKMYSEDDSAHNQTNEHEMEGREEMKLPLKETNSDLVVDGAVAQLSEENKIPEEVHREINEQTEERVT